MNILMTFSSILLKHTEFHNQTVAKWLPMVSFGIPLYSFVPLKDDFVAFVAKDVNFTVFLNKTIFC